MELKNYSVISFNKDTEPVHQDLDEHKDIQILLKDNVLCYKNANRIRPISIMSFLYTKIKIFIFKRTVRYEKYYYCTIVNCLKVLRDGM